MQRVRAVLGVAVGLMLCLWCLAAPALAVKTVSTSDGVSLTFTDQGAFSSMTVDGNTVPTLTSVAGGFFIYPMDGQALNYLRDTFHAGTQILGTATQEGSNVRITGTAQNQTFDILLTGGLPYLKVDGTVTGNGSDHVFLVDFRLPVDAQGWNWGESVNTTEVIDTGPSNWYFSDHVFRWTLHPNLSANPFGSITKTTTPAMGLSLAPLFYPPCAYAIQYNGQGGFWIQFELGTTPKTTKHPNTADFHFVIYKHDPKWGNRSAVARYHGFFPQFFEDRYPGGNWILEEGGGTSHAEVLPSIPTDFALKYIESQRGFDDSYITSNNLYNLKYQEPWCAHTTWTTIDEVEQMARNIPENAVEEVHAKGLTAVEWAQALLLSGVQNPDGTYVGNDDYNFWQDNNQLYRWLTNPDPELPNFRNLAPGRTRADTIAHHEMWDNWATPPSPGNEYSGLFHDSATGWWAGWGIVHNFNPNHWPYYDYNPGIYQGTRFDPGQVSMWAPYSNLEMMIYAARQMRPLGRPILSNSDAAYELFLIAPWVDVIGAGESFMGENGSARVRTMSLERAIAGTKPVSFLFYNGDGTQITDLGMQKCMLLGIYPGLDRPSDGNWEAIRPRYQTFMPIFNQLDAAGWRPITAATVTTTNGANAWVERFGPDSNGDIFLTVLGPETGDAVTTANGTAVTVYSADLGWVSNPNVTVTALYGAAPTTSYSNGNLVLTFGTIATENARCVKLHYNGTATAPNASFSANVTSGAAPLSVNFTDTSAGSPTSWYWSFGDGALSQSQHPSHTFAAGTYTVSLMVTSSVGMDLETKCDYIVAGAAPVADFVASPKRIRAGDNFPTRFFDQSTNSPTSWSWSFGDGNYSSDKNPIHLYTTAGTYTVSLTATNSYGSDGETKTGFITVLNSQMPVAGFLASETMASAPLTVNFTDTSGYTPTSWSWSFGDGNTSTAQHPSHTYSSNGIYTVSLTVTNATGSNTLTKQDYIAVLNETLLYPTYTELGSGVGVVSGTLSNLQTSDNSYYTLSCNSSQNLKAGFYNDTGLDNHDYYGIKVEYEGSSSSATTPQALLWSVGRSSPFNVGSWNPFGTTDRTFSWRTRNAWAYLNTFNNERVGFEICGCPVGTTSYNFRNDLVKFHLYLKPGASAAPVANFTGNPTSGAAPLEVFFTDTSTNSPTSWSWNFGDSSTSTVKNPSHTYSSAGNYTVSLRATNAAGYDDEVKTSYITVSSGGSAPVAAFSGTPTSGTAPLSVSFTDQSTNTPTSWSWNFGDGSTSTSQNPSHSYAAGTYTVSLRATNAAGYDDEVKSNYITATVPAPVAAFTGTPTSGTAPLSVSFTDQSTNTPTSWSWNFGDSTTSTSQNPSHSYAAGTYTVSLRATNAGGYDDEVKTNYITATSGATTPTFVAAGAVATGTGTITPALPAGIQSNDILLLFVESANQAASVSNPNGGTWTEVTNSPQYTGTAGGTAATRLTAFWSRYNGTQGNPTVSDSGNHTTGRIIAVRGCITSGDPWDVTAGGVESTADTSGSIPGATTTVTNTLVVAAIATALPDASGTANFSSWSNANLTSLTERTDNTSSSGNGGGLAIATGEKATAGAYGNTAVTCGSSTVKAMLSVALKPAGGVTPPVAAFTGTPTSGTAPLNVSFTDQSTNTPTSWSWNFGDSTTSTSQNPSHSYAAGTYTVSLRATNAGGYDDEVKTNYITATPPAPVANFTGTPTSGTAPLSVSFTDQSTNSPTSWSWNFGDSSTSTSQNPSHSYAAGTYTVSLRATNAGGYDDEVKTDYITATSGGGTEVTYYTEMYELAGGTTLASGSIADTYAADGSYMRLSCDTSGQDFHIRIDFRPVEEASQIAKIKLEYRLHVSRADTPNLSLYVVKTAGGSDTIWGPGQFSTTDQTVTWETTNPSAYMDSQRWIITDICGCPVSGNTNNYDVYLDLAKATITLIGGGSAPVAAFTGTPTSGAAPLAVTFTDQSTNTPTSWSWNFGDGNTSTSQNPSHSYAAGTYTVSLRATNAYGYDDEVKTDYITASAGGSAPVAAFSGAPTSGAAPLAVTFTDQSTNTPTSWSWNFGDGNTSTSQNPSHSYAAGTYTVSLRATNAYGYDDEVKTNYITATPPAPVANFSGSPTSGQAPLAVTFTDSSTNAPTSWSWNFGDSATSTAQHPSHTYNAAGSYTVSLRATNAGGYDDEVKTNYITATNPESYPNGWSSWAGCTIASGSLTDVQTSNDVRLVYNSGGSQQHQVWWTFDSPRTPSQLSKLRVEIEWNTSLTDTPNYSVLVWDYVQSAWIGIGSWTRSTSDTWFTWESTDVSRYMNANGEMGITTCGCPQNGSAYLTRFDTVRIVEYLQ